MATISIIGTGYVGLVYGAAFADLGNHVYGVDINQEKVKLLQSGVCPIFEPGLEEMLQRNLEAGRLEFTSSYAESVPNSEFAFICVDTPSAFSGEADMRMVRSAAEMLGKALSGHTIIINKSTMPIGSGDLVSSIVEQHRNPDATFAVVSNPEFLREGNAVRDVFQPSRIVLGSTNEDACAAVSELYRTLDAPTVVTDTRTAEMIKYASNAILATRISFVNEIAQICEGVSADITVVSRGMGLDPRIGPLFLDAGIGFGGSCFPKDVRALAHMAAEAGTHPQLLHAVLEINQDQRRRFVHKLQDILEDLNGKRIAVWGLSFKQDTDDIRESPAIDVIRMLLQRGATVIAYDPAAMENARTEIPDLETAENQYDAVDGADALILITPWNQFRQANLGRVRELLKTPVLLDGRNMYEPEDVRKQGFIYAGIGR
ncbi:MAG: UDP-glucose/GDP-mannose dehydrogenase family protein [Sphaerobacteraceae bacterium]|nr:MAG: UDP-glucose/GDP-mannose dehydrogenase family protein [Sphaerobacteraceae bacterium]